MVYSAKKPYQKQSKDYVRFLKETIGPESVFEKPYLQKEYTEMNQAPNTPSVPPSVGGFGGLVCLYSPTECEINAECYAGPEIKIDGGPEEADAGYLSPEVINGYLVKWDIGSDPRQITLVLDPNQARNIITVSFKDGWGNVYTETIYATCQVVLGWVLMVNFTDLDASLNYYLGTVLYDTAYGALVAVPDDQLWRSLNNGVSWTYEGTVADRAYCGVYDVAHGTLIVSGYQRRMYVSSNGGDSWSLTQQLTGSGSNRAYAMVYDPVNETTVAFVYVNPDTQVWRTTDGGNSWTLIDTLADTSTPSDAVFDPVNSTILLSTGIVAGSSVATEIWISDDGGATWALKKDLKTDYALDFIGAMEYDTTRSRVVALVRKATGNDLMWGSSDGGANWSEIVDFGSLDVLMFILAYYASPDKFYISVLDGGGTIETIYTSATGGASWVAEKTFDASESVTNITAVPTTGSVFVGTSNGNTYELHIWRITE